MKRIFLTILTFFIFIEVLFSRSIDQYPLENFKAEKFLQEFNFSQLIKYEFENKEANKRQPIRKAIEDVIEFKNTTIQTLLLTKLGAQCVLIEDASQYEDFNDVKSVIGGNVDNVVILNCQNYDYIIWKMSPSLFSFNDNISVYRIDQDSDLMNDLETIISVSIILNNIKERISILFCGNRSLDDCLNVNLFAHTHIFYEKYFSTLPMETEDNLLNSVYLNLKSSKILRFCAVAQIHFSKFFTRAEGNKQDFETIIAQCVISMYNNIVDFHKQNGLENEFDEDSRIKDPFEGENKEIKDVSNPLNAQMYIKPNEKVLGKFTNHIYTVLKYFKSTDDYVSCINNMRTPQIFFELMFPEEETFHRIVTRKNLTYDIYDQMYFLPTNYNSLDNTTANRILNPFMSACNIWTRNDFVTTGSMEFELYEKEITAKEPTKIMSCTSVMEMFFENLGLALYHLFVDNKGKTDAKFSEEQFNAITLSRFIKKAFYAIYLTCTNDFGVQIESFVKDKTEIFKADKSGIFIMFLDKKKLADSGGVEPEYTYEDYLKGMDETVQTTIDALQDFYIASAQIIFKTLNFDGLNTPGGNSSVDNSVIGDELHEDPNTTQNQSTVNDSGTNLEQDTDKKSTEELLV
jgi:hypothetical protein